MNQIIKCRLEDLKIGDKVLIEHAHTFHKSSGWSNFSPTYYFLINVTINFGYLFEREDFKQERFLLEPTTNDKGSVKFIGRCLTDDEIKLKKLNIVLE